MATPALKCFWSVELLSKRSLKMLPFLVVALMIGTVVGYFAVSFGYETVPKRSSILKSFVVFFADLTLLLKMQKMS